MCAQPRVRAWRPRYFLLSCANGTAHAARSLWWGAPQEREADRAERSEEDGALRRTRTHAHAHVREPWKREHRSGGFFHLTGRECLLRSSSYTDSAVSVSGCLCCSTCVLSPPVFVFKLPKEVVAEPLGVSVSPPPTPSSTPGELCWIGPCSVQSQLA